MATDMKRISISLSDENDRAIVELKKTDQFCRCSYAEIVRVLIELGVQAMKAQQSA